MAGYAINPKESLVDFVGSPTFMVGIWHEGDWLKERLGSVQYMVRWYVEVSNVVGFFICNKIFFPLVFHEYLYLL